MANFAVFSAADIKALGLLGALAPRPAIAALRPREMNTKSNTATGGNTTDISRIKVRSGTRALRGIQVVYGNFYQGTGELIDVAASTIIGAIENVSPQYSAPLLFNGVRTATMQPGDYVISDIIPFDVAPQTDFWVRTGRLAGVAGDVWPAIYSNATGLTGEGVYQSTVDPTTDVYGFGALGARGSAGNGFGPIGIIGIPADVSAAPTSIVALGDSLMSGNSDTADSYGCAGYARAFNNIAGKQIPVMSQARNSDRASYNIQTSFRKRVLWRFANTLFCDLGTNDMAEGTLLTPAQLQAHVISIATMAKNNGMQVWWCDLLPRCTSGNVPITGFESGGNKRDVQNAWLYAQEGQGLIDKVVRVGRAVENPAALGTWQAAYLNDGVHPNKAGYDAICADIQSQVSSLIVT